jgi:hypothetical protein
MTLFFQQLAGWKAPAKVIPDRGGRGWGPR